MGLESGHERPQQRQPAAFITASTSRLTLNSVPHDSRVEWHSPSWQSGRSMHHTPRSLSTTRFSAARDNGLSPHVPSRPLLPPRAIRVDNMRHEKVGHIKREQAMYLSPLIDRNLLRIEGEEGRLAACGGACGVCCDVVLWWVVVLVNRSRRRREGGESVR